MFTDLPRRQPIYTDKLIMKTLLLAPVICVVLTASSDVTARVSLGEPVSPEQAPAQAATPAPVATPTDVKAGSITCEDVAYPYPYPTSYLPLTLYGQDVRMAYMDVPPLGEPNGHTVVLLHGNNFAGFYFAGPIDALRKEGFRVVVPDQIGYGRSSKPIIPYNFHDMARNTHLVLQGLNVPRVMVVGHSMGGMLAARFATQYPDVVERLVLYNPIYARIRYAWTLGADWPRLAMVQTLLGQLPYLDPVVDDWAHIRAPTLVFGGAEDSLPGSSALFKARMKFVADTIPNGNGRLHLIAGIGHVPHMEAPEKTYPPLVAFLKEGAGQ
jgi:pimeloyl-ACP methyl ester carboxylesterase